MNDPILEEACRANTLQPHVLRRLQRHLQTVIDPALGELALLREENAALKEQLAVRKPGRPRKEQSEAVPA